ncbi:WXG100 family type VII secretion target [uncultured Georgenia sp.]|uniref:WXG100 family type VII secretion target n=1 Tax=uncultured Georgenia sp. TaxID=378209 RepID=UPI002624CC44|nr:WXG100 family type VII secretion target [uncultured Georgenia sp.]HLV04975.1 WXG100 family type VII secretion target [Actinomycetaceae bacterium]
MGPAETPEELRALAGRMDDVAAQVRELGSDLLALREEIGWRSVAASEYQGSLTERAEETARTADLVDEVAHALRAHADGVAETLATIEAARSFLMSAYEEARSVLADLWSGVIDAITPSVEHAQRVVDLVAGAPAGPVDLGWVDRARQAGWGG